MVGFDSGGRGVELGDRLQRKVSRTIYRRGDLPGGSHSFTRRLPPDFSDFVTDLCSPTRKRTWRRAPTGEADDALLFCAADLDTLKDIGARLHRALFIKPRGIDKDLTGEFLALREWPSGRRRACG